MSETAEFYYFHGRGLGEPIRIALCAAKIPFKEIIMERREQMLELLEGNRLQFAQLPLLVIDGLNLVQSHATVTYIAAKAGLLGDNNKMAAKINILYDGSRDFYRAFLPIGFLPQEELLQAAREKTLPKYLPIFNKVLQENATGFLVGSQLSLADLGLYEALLATVEYFGDSMLAEYKNLQEFLAMMNSREEMKLYLTKYRKPPNDDVYVTTVKRVLEKDPLKD